MSDKETIVNILSKLHSTESNSVSDKSRKQALIGFQYEYGMTIPLAYFEFMELYDGVIFNDIVQFEISHKMLNPMSNNLAYIDEFYGLYELSEVMVDYKDRVPSALLPIGGISGGDLLCIGVDGDSNGKIYLWKHEQELVAKLMLGLDTHTDDVNLYWDNVLLVAHSFVDFLNVLDVAPEETVASAPVGNVKVWLADDL